MSKPKSLPTPLIYFVIPPLIIISCAAFAVGITFAPCYSSLCVEKYYASAARIHVAVFYSLLAGIGLGLTACKLSPKFRRLCEWHLVARPILGVRISLGGVLLTLCIAGVSIGSSGYWLPAQNVYWLARAEMAHWTDRMTRVIWTAVTGHWIDIWMGLVVIPVGRNSVLARAFDIHGGSLLLTHKLLAYSLLVGSAIHGLLYYAFLASLVKFKGQPGGAQFLPDNPTVTEAESESIGLYSAFPLPTGALAGFILIPIMTVTSLPYLRKINYNTFYYVHIILAILVMILVCLHASTCFYFILPGILLWIGDWIWRVFNSLRKEVPIVVEDAGNGWYRIQLPLDTPIKESDSDVENFQHSSALALSQNPLATFCINIRQVSKLEIHPFTAASVGSTLNGPLLILQKSIERKKEKKTNREWTWKLAALVDGTPERSITVNARIEGSYSPPSADLFAADQVLAIVGGTGITGALSIAQWWTSHNPSSPPSSKSLRIVWTVRNHESAELKEAQELMTLMRDSSSMEFLVHVSAESGRISPETVLRAFLSAREKRVGRGWVYTSGPEGLLIDTETACIKQKKKLTKTFGIEGISSLDWYAASYSC